MPDTSNNKNIARQQKYIAVISALFMLATGMVIAGVAISPLYQNLNQLQQSKLTDKVKLQSQAINQYLSELVQITVQITTRTKAREKLEAYNHSEVSLADAQSYLAPILDDSLQRYESMLSVTRFDINNKPVISIGEPIPEGSWIFPSDPGNTAIIKGPTDCANKTCLVIAAPILDRSFEIVGTDIVTFDFSTLITILNSSIDSGGPGKTVLVNTENGASRTLFDSDNLNSDVLPFVDSQSVQSRILASINKDSSGFIRINDPMTNSPYLVSYQQINGTNWILFEYVESKQFYEPIFSQIFYLGIIIIAILLFSLLVIYALLRPFNQRLADSTQALINSEAKFRTLVENSPYCIHEIDNEFKLISMNNAGLQLMNLESEDQVIGTDYLDAVSRQEQPRIKQLMISAFGGTTHEFEFTSVNRRLFQSSFNPIFGKDGKVDRLMGITIDITERRQIERDLLLTNFAIEKTQDAIYWIRPDASFFYVNQAACNMLGYTQEELLTMNVFDIDPDFDQEDMARAWEHISVNKSITLETHHRSKDGHIFPIEVRSHYLEYEGNAFNCAVVRDISLQKEAEEKLQQSHNKLRQLVARLQSTREEERTRVSREYHDELGQSLTGLRIDLTWILKHSPADNKDLTERTETALNLVNQVLTSTQRLAYDLRPSMLDDLGLGATIEWQINEFKRRTDCQCNLNINLDDLELDSERDTVIFRIVQEALDNISRHAQASTVEISLRVESDWIKLDIADDGEGIDTDELEISESIGLVGMQERAKSVGGHVEIGPQSSGGTLVRIEVPLHGNQAGP